MSSFESSCVELQSVLCTMALIGRKAQPRHQAEHTAVEPFETRSGNEALGQMLQLRLGRAWRARFSLIVTAAMAVATFATVTFTAMTLSAMTLSAVALSVVMAVTMI